MDSQALICIGLNLGRIPSRVSRIVENTDDKISVSIASIWEIGIKFSIGKLPLKSNILGLEQQVIDHGFTVIPINVMAIHEMTSLPMHHKDPFDRIIAATAMISGDILLSSDTIFDQYGLSRVWD
jgi:PIN domain nuclease of toxin-antitoxin system